ncbi:MAG: hypothetical protein JW793_07805 [Acidobacteria bacterium]|nr:hypothetical protein [Acidobacteriota bacterium]
MISCLEEGEALDPDDLADWQEAEYEMAKEIVADDGSRFIAPPDDFEFNEYEVMEHFIGSVEDDETANRLLRAIKGRGAFRRFKDTVHRLGIQQSWYDYLEEAQREFVTEWAEENGVVVEDDLRKPGK